MIIKEGTVIEITQSWDKIIKGDIYILTDVLIQHECGKPYRQYVAATLNPIRTNCVDRPIGHILYLNEFKVNVLKTMKKKMLNIA